MDSFYVILPSNTGDVEGNTTSKFTVRMPDTLELDSSWTVALSNIIYPFSFSLFGDSDENESITVYRRYGEILKSIRIELPDISFASEEAIEESLNSVLLDVMHQELEQERKYLENEQRKQDIYNQGSFRRKREIEPESIKVQLNKKGYFDLTVDEYKDFQKILLEKDETKVPGLLHLSKEQDSSGKFYRLVPKRNDYELFYNVIDQFISIQQANFQSKSYFTAQLSKNNYFDMPKVKFTSFLKYLITNSINLPRMKNAPISADGGEMVRLTPAKDDIEKLKTAIEEFMKPVVEEISTEQEEKTVEKSTEQEEKTMEQSTDHEEKTVEKPTEQEIIVEDSIEKSKTETELHPISQEKSLHETDSEEYVDQLPDGEFSLDESLQMLDNNGYLELPERTTYKFIQFLNSTIKGAKLPRLSKVLKDSAQLFRIKPEDDQKELFKNAIKLFSSKNSKNLEESPLQVEPIHDDEPTKISETTENTTSKDEIVEPKEKEISLPEDISENSENSSKISEIKTEKEDENENVQPSPTVMKDKITEIEDEQNNDKPQEPSPDEENVQKSQVSEDEIISENIEPSTPVDDLTKVNDPEDNQNLITNDEKQIVNDPDDKKNLITNDEKPIDRTPLDGKITPLKHIEKPIAKIELTDDQKKLLDTAVRAAKRAWSESVELAKQTQDNMEIGEEYWRKARFKYSIRNMVVTIKKTGEKLHLKKTPENIVYWVRAQLRVLHNRRLLIEDWTQECLEKGKRVAEAKRDAEAAEEHGDVSEARKAADRAKAAASKVREAHKQVDESVAGQKNLALEIINKVDEELLKQQDKLIEDSTLPTISNLPTVTEEDDTDPWEHEEVIENIEPESLALQEPSIPTIIEEEAEPWTAVEKLDDTSKISTKNVIQEPAIQTIEVDEEENSISDSSQINQPTVELIEPPRFEYLKAEEQEPMGLGEFVSSIFSSSSTTKQKEENLESSQQKEILQPSQQKENLQSSQQKENIETTQPKEKLVQNNLIDDEDYSYINYNKITFARYAYPPEYKKMLLTLTKTQLADPTIQWVSIHYDKVHKRFHLVLQGNVEYIRLSRQLAYTLGFNSQIVYNGQVAKYMPDISGGVRQFLVYAPRLVENTIIGNVTAPLLRVVNVGGKPGESVSEVYMTEHHHRLLGKRHPDITIEIRTLTGKLVKFHWGSCILTLHFQRSLF